MRIERLLVVGGTSGIGFETAKCFAADGTRMVLAGRDLAALEANCSALRTLGARQAEPLVLDVLDHERHPGLAKECVALMGGLDGVLVAHGVAHVQGEVEADPALAREEISVNLSASVSLLLHMAEHFEQQGHGVMSAIASVAADRGRREQYVYAATKSGLATFMQGFRQRMARFGVRVLTIKPGLTDTPLTSDIVSPLSRLLFSSSARVGRCIHRALNDRGGVVYAPWYWRWILLAVRLVPERVLALLGNGLLGERRK